LYCCLGGTNEQDVLDKAESKSGRYGEFSYVLNLKRIYNKTVKKGCKNLAYTPSLASSAKHF